MAPKTAPVPLPDMEGPKLEPFRGTASADIKFERFLGSSKDLDSKVWKVSIDGRTYALKIFPFQNWEYLQLTTGSTIIPPKYDPRHRPPLTPQEYINYLDPFHCECRVYGRLKNEGREDLAVRAYGYVLLTQAQERQVTVALGEDYVDWEKHPKPLDCSGIFTRFEAHRHARVRAIVKELVPTTEPWTAPQIPQMYADLEDLHALGILVRDIHQGNYLGGKLLDFSQAWTMYHPCLDRSTPRGVYLRRQSEPQKFEEMVDVWAASERVKIKKPAGLLKWHSGQESDFGVDPRQYPWQTRNTGKQAVSSGTQVNTCGITSITFQLKSTSKAYAEKAPSEIVQRTTIDTIEFTGTLCQISGLVYAEEQVCCGTLRGLGQLKNDELQPLD